MSDDRARDFSIDLYAYKSVITLSARHYFTIVNNITTVYYFLWSILYCGEVSGETLNHHY